MAQKVLVQLIDDLDGTVSEEAETVQFALDGVQYEIDLKADNAAKLRDSLKDFIENARRSGARGRRGAAPTTRKIVAESRTKEQTKAIREWAKANGHELSDRGRIPTNIIEEFERTHR